MGREQYLHVCIVLAAVGFITAACAPPESNKTVLQVCTAGKDGCPSEDRSKGSNTGSSDDDSDRSQNSGKNELVSAGDDPTKKDAGTTGTKALGKLCKELSACCDKLDADGLTSFCREALDTGIESVCYTKRKEYQQRDPDTGEAPCP